MHHHQIVNEVVGEFDSPRPSSAEEWRPVLTELCKPPLDLAVPLLLPKHIAELEKFSRTVFKAGDFMEPISFDSLEIEIFPEKKKETHAEYFFGT